MNAPASVTARREKHGTYVYYVAHCSFGACDWVAPERRQLESEAWGDLLSHLRAEHGGSVKEVRIHRTVIEELLEQE